MLELVLGRETSLGNPVMLMGGRFGESAGSTKLVVNLVVLHVSFKKNKENSYWDEECDYSQCWFASAGAFFSFRRTIRVAWCL